jgi:pSer/pThr/pTyr-binding forkhead associated (FHA) protein
VTDQICMQNESNSMLFCPPLAPLRLGREQFIVIGRTPRCDMTLRHEDVSRRHAEIGFENDRFIVRDLGSTNGTYLNGKEIAGTEVLSPGDRIEVGPQIITFCEIESAGDGDESTPDGDQTIIAMRTPSQTNAFAGDLSQIPPFAVLQVLEMGGKSGVLEISTGNTLCKIWFLDGAPIHAESASQRGFDAAVLVVNAETGTFHFDPCPVSREVTIQCTVPQLLLEACRQLDEAKA